MCYFTSIKYFYYQYYELFIVYKHFDDVDKKKTKLLFRNLKAFRVIIWLIYFPIR